MGTTEGAGKELGRSSLRTTLLCIDSPKAPAAASPMHLDLGADFAAAKQVE
jgi:hypothetical protein